MITHRPESNIATTLIEKIDFFLNGLSIKKYVARDKNNTVINNIVISE